MGKIVNYTDDIGKRVVFICKNCNATMKSYKFPDHMTINCLKCKSSFIIDTGVSIDKKIKVKWVRPNQ